MSRCRGLQLIQQGIVISGWHEGKEKLEIVQGDQIIFTLYYSSNNGAYGKRYAGPFTHEVPVVDFIRVLKEYLAPDLHPQPLEPEREYISINPEFERQKRHYEELRRQNGSLKFEDAVAWNSINDAERQRRASYRD